jgi:hypothetical protein
MASLSLPRPLSAAAGTLRGWALARLAVPPLGPTEPHPPVGDPANVLWLTDLSESLISYESNNDDFTGGSPTENDLAHVRYELRDRDGVLLGTTRGVGRMLYKRREDGHHIAYFSEEITLLDGNVVRTGGLVDDAKLTEGEQQTIPAVVVAGPLRGAVGFRQFRPVDTHKLYASGLLLHRR